MKQALVVLSLLNLMACAGEMGPMGHTGNDGHSIVGPQGLPGAPGSNGADGQGCTVVSIAAGNPEAPNGGALVTCGDTSVLVTNGLDGAAGSNGTNATPVVMEKLCPGTPSYPSTFVEFAALINGNLYAVYSANGGFFTQIPPGAYTSNGIGSSCNFTVNADLSISN